MEEEIEIRMADGTTDAVLYRAEDGRRQPGVIHLPTSAAFARPTAAWRGGWLCSGTPC
ncbi:MAG TPA: hypothetical protein VKZ50_17495 [bacterium]|nr:hypothetical protein [bacterium]